MNFYTIADWWIVFFIAATITVYEALCDLLLIFKEGIFIDQKILQGIQRKVLMKKTNKELKAMLVGIKNLSKKNKDQLIELVLINS
tara:strand:+ start:279 stop:536 length:258 start_codon:yes stop_codon:yes gene_type:complete